MTDDQLDLIDRKLHSDAGFRWSEEDVSALFFYVQRLREENALLRVVADASPLSVGVRSVVEGALGEMVARRQPVKWTSEKPTVSGWYWAKFDGGDGVPLVVDVYMSNGVATVYSACCGDDYPFDFDRCAGPMVAP